MPIRYYPTADRRFLAVKPWAVSQIKKVAEHRREPAIKVLTDAIEHAYNDMKLQQKQK